MDRLLDRRSR